MDIKNKVREQGSKEAIEKTVRQLKTEEARKITSSVLTNEQDDVKRGTSKQQPNTISRNGGSMFRRF
jgi:hypothetical protein